MTRHKRTFIEWLETRLKSNNPVGDLARDTLAWSPKTATKARRDVKDLDSLLSHMRAVSRPGSPCDGALRAAKKAWKSYQAAERRLNEQAIR